MDRVGLLFSPCGVLGLPPFNNSTLCAPALGRSCRAPIWAGADPLLFFQESLVGE